MKAQNHLIWKNLDEAEKKEPFQGAENAYKELTSEIDKDFRIEIAPELYIHERAMKIEKIERNPLLKHKSKKPELDSESVEAL